MYPHTHHQPDKPILEVSQVFLSYGNYDALVNVTFQLCPRERVAIVGPNGAGKSSLIKIVAGITRPTKGEVAVYGSKPGAHVCIGYIPQRLHVDWRFPVTVGDVVMMGRLAKIGLFGWPKKNDWQFVYEIMKSTGIADLAKRQIGELSGGQQQRMFISRALAQEAELLLLDEPLAGLDMPAQESILKLLADLSGRGVTIMAATHDLHQAADYFDKVMLIKAKLIAFGKPDYVLVPGYLTEAYGNQLTRLGTQFITDTCCDGEPDVHHY